MHTNRYRYDDEHESISPVTDTCLCTNPTNFFQLIGYNWNISEENIRNYIEEIFTKRKLQTMPELISNNFQIFTHERPMATFGRVFTMNFTIRFLSFFTVSIYFRVPFQQEHFMLILNSLVKCHHLQEPKHPKRTPSAHQHRLKMHIKQTLSQLKYS